MPRGRRARAAPASSATGAPLGGIASQPVVNRLHATILRSANQALNLGVDSREPYRTRNMTPRPTRDCLPRCTDADSRVTRGGGAVRMPARKALGIACAVTTVGFVTLVGCGSAPDAPAANGSQVQLFEEAYSGISRYYIEPVRPAALAMAGLGNLARIDAGLSVERAGDQVILHDASAATRFS